MATLMQTISGNIQDYLKKIKEDKINADAEKNMKQAQDIAKHAIDIGDKTLEAKATVGGTDEEIAAKARDVIKKKGLDHTQYSTGQLVDFFKQKYGVNTYDDILNGKSKVNDVLNPARSIGSQIPGAIGLGLTAGAAGLIASKVTGTKLPTKLTANGTIPLEKKVQRKQATLLDEVLNVSKNDMLDRDAITQTIAEKYKPVKNFDELLAQAKNNLTDRPGTLVNQRSKILTKYATEHGYEYLKPLKEYVNELAANPQAKTQLDKAQDILATEEAFIKKQGDKLTTAQLEIRKEQLNNDLKRFYNKDKSLMSEIDTVEQQAKSKLQNGAMTEIENIAKGTPDEGIIKTLNKDMQTNFQIKSLAEEQAAKFKGVKLPSKAEKVMTTAGRIPIIGPRIRNAGKELLMTKDQKTINKLESFMTKLTKLGKEGKFNGLKSQISGVIDPTNTPILLESLLGIIENNTKKGGFTNTEAKQYKELISTFNKQFPGTVAANKAFLNKDEQKSSWYKQEAQRNNVQSIKERPQGGVEISI